MTVIVYGHVAGWAPLAQFPPIYSKQLGVAFFLFVSGYTLSRETGDRWHVAFNRLFEVYLFGVAFAILVSAIALALGVRPQLSNYYPLLGGANVLFNNFPANPTTWYLGTYVHVVVLWALLLRRVRVSLGLVACAFVLEIALRVLLRETAGDYVAYMAVTNWMTVFLLGTWHGQRDGRLTKAAAEPLGVNGLAVAALVVAVGGWATLAAGMPFDRRAFPFIELPSHQALVTALLESAMVSTIYVGVTWLMFRSVERVPAPRPVRFVARNTLIVLLAHMPVYYVAGSIVATRVTSIGLRSAIYFTLCLPGLALVSEAVRGWVRPREWRERLYAQLCARAVGRVPLVRSTIP
jgi:hypothetical protein